MEKLPSLEKRAVKFYYISTALIKNEIKNMFLPSKRTLSNNLG